MATGVNELLDMLFEMIDEAKNVPLSSDKCMLERDKALDLIDEIRGQFPMELAEAKKLLAARNDYLASSSSRRRRRPSRCWPRTSCWPKPSRRAPRCSARPRIGPGS